MTNIGLRANNQRHRHPPIILNFDSASWEHKMSFNIHIFNYPSDNSGWDMYHEIICLNFLSGSNKGDCSDRLLVKLPLNA